MTKEFKNRLEFQNKIKEIKMLSNIKYGINHDDLTNEDYASSYFIEDTYMDKDENILYKITIGLFHKQPFIEGTINELNKLDFNENISKEKQLGTDFYYTEFSGYVIVSNFNENDSNNIIRSINNKIDENYSTYTFNNLDADNLIDEINGQLKNNNDSNEIIESIKEKIYRYYDVCAFNNIKLDDNNINKVFELLKITERADNLLNEINNNNNNKGE